MKKVIKERMLNSNITNKLEIIREQKQKINWKRLFSMDTKLRIILQYLKQYKASEMLFGMT